MDGVVTAGYFATPSVLIVPLERNFIGRNAAISSGAVRPPAYWTLPSPLRGIAEPESLLSVSFAGVAVMFHTRAVW